jgi:AraC family transcriptional regulator
MTYSWLFVVIVFGLLSIALAGCDNGSTPPAPATHPADTSASAPATSQSADDKVEVRDVPARRVAYMRALGDPKQVLPKLWPTFVAAAAPLGILDKGRTLSIMQDAMAGLPAEKQRNDMAVEIGADWKPQGGIDVETVDGGLYAVSVYQGPYDGLGDAWMELATEWMTSSGYHMRIAPCYEIYLNRPAHTAPDDLRTEIYLPVTKNK